MKVPFKLSTILPKQATNNFQTTGGSIFECQTIVVRTCQPCCCGSFIHIKFVVTDKYSCEKIMPSAQFLFIPLFHIYQKAKIAFKFAAKIADVNRPFKRISGKLCLINPLSSSAHPCLVTVWHASK